MQPVRAWPLQTSETKLSSHSIFISFDDKHNLKSIIISPRITCICTYFFFVRFFLNLAVLNRGENLKTLKTSSEVIEVFDILECLWCHFMSNKNNWRHFESVLRLREEEKKSVVFYINGDYSSRQIQRKTAQGKQPWATKAVGKRRSDSGVLYLPPKCKAKPLRVERGRQAESTECSVSEMSAMTAPGVLAEFLRGV